MKPWSVAVLFFEPSEVLSLFAPYLTGATVSCPICEKRKPSRFCPAKGESICAVCCGTGREVTIDCVPDCPHLVAAHRYEDEHPRALPGDTPLLDVNLPGDTVHTHQQLMAALAFTIVQFCATQRDATDPDVLAAIQALAETYKTLRTGIYYEKPPDARLPRELYAALTSFIAEVKQQPSTFLFFSTVWACCAPMGGRAPAATSNSSAANSPTHKN
jgi:hypothetical protein